jgi:hypothetical protein
METLLIWNHDQPIDSNVVGGDVLVQNRKPSETSKSESSYCGEIDFLRCRILLDEYACVSDSLRSGCVPALLFRALKAFDEAFALRPKRDVLLPSEVLKAWAAARRKRAR